jgi:UDP-3-O-[3-hydroxymyristoyl] N-acetylglucosamine deacetylase
MPAEDLAVGGDHPDRDGGRDSVRTRLARSIRVDGIGLHSGAVCSVTLNAAAGPTTLGRGRDRAAIAALSIAGSDRTTTATLPSGERLAAIEHLLAAIAGASAFDGLSIDVEGDELPLLDGGAARWFDAIDALAPDRRCARVAHVVAAAEFEHEGTRLSIAPAGASTSKSIEVDVAFPAERFGRALHGVARWSGDRADFRARIAPSRTFGAARELDWLRAHGLAAHVPEGAVVALDLDDPRRAPTDPEEPIRHKLLDAIGDLASLGAAIEGIVRITRPSHRGTLGALAAAVAASAIVVRTRTSG